MELTKIKSNATNLEIWEVMKHPQTNVGFLTHPSLPSQTFVSADAIQWLNNHIEGGVEVERGIDIMQVETQKLFSSIQYDLQNLILLLLLNSDMSEKRKRFTSLHIKKCHFFLHVWDSIHKTRLFL